MRSVKAHVCANCLQSKRCLGRIVLSAGIYEQGGYKGGEQSAMVRLLTDCAICKPHAFDGGHFSATGDTAKIKTNWEGPDLTFNSGVISFVYALAACRSQQARFIVSPFNMIKTLPAAYFSLGKKLSVQCYRHYITPPCL